MTRDSEIELIVERIKNLVINEIESKTNVEILGSCLIAIGVELIEELRGETYATKAAADVVDELIRQKRIKKLINERY